jgi:hypothetical protein
MLAAKPLSTVASILFGQSVASMNKSARMEEIEVLRVKLAVLKSEHRDLDLAIEALHERGSNDMLTIKRLKKQKLALKDRIVALEDRILPDIIA